MNVSFFVENSDVRFRFSKERRIFSWVFTVDFADVEEAVLLSSWPIMLRCLIN